MLIGRHLLQPRPRRHAVDLEHGRPPVGAVQDIDAGKVGADRRGGARPRAPSLRRRRPRRPAGRPA